MPRRPDQLKAAKIPGPGKKLWKPGQSGNPAGRSPLSPIIAPIIRRLMEMTPKALAAFKPATVAEELALAQITTLRLGPDDKGIDLRRFEALTSRIDGMPRQTIEHEGSTGVFVVETSPSEEGI